MSRETTLASNRGGRSAVLRPLQSLLQSGVLGDRSDGELLREFITHRKETAEPAFTTIVTRHGPMVWRVCRSVLSDLQDAEDAFQATFLVLVQHAHSVRRKDSLASWLYGVAYRVACCVRSAQARRKRHEEHASAAHEQEARQSEPERAELREIIAQELNRLSKSQRLAVLLCDLEELTHEQAAAQLGWPLGTVKSRLARGRERLKTRLIRRGVAPALGLIGAAALSEPGMGAPPAALVSSVVRFALGASAGLSVTGATSGTITFLIREVSQAMWISKLKWTTLVVLTSSALGVGGTVLWQRSEARQAPPARADGPAPPPNVNRDDDAIWARHAGNLKRIGLALHNYVAAEGHFPAAAITGKDGKPLLSWRVAILPYLEDYSGHRCEDLYKAFRLDEPWDSPHNKALLARMPAVFASPAKGNQQAFTTAYRGFVSVKEKGHQAAMRGMMEPMKGQLEHARVKSKVTDQPKAGAPAGAGGGMSPMMGGGAGGGGGMASMMGGMGAMMGRAQAEDSAPFGSQTFFREKRGVGMEEITDGTSNTIMVVEAAEAVPWTKPGDLPFPSKVPLPRLGGSLREGFAALFADGRVRLLNQDINEDRLRSLIGPNDGIVISMGSLDKDVRESVAPSQNESQRYTGAGTLENAAGILRDKLKHEGKSELAEWLSEPKWSVSQIAS